MKQQRIFRNASPTGHFTTISNTLLQDNGLSLEARGLQTTFAPGATAC